MNITWKKIAVAGVLSGGLSMAALGLGAGAANADTGDIPFVPGNGSDMQSYFPLIERLGDVVNLGGLGKTGAENTGSPGKLGDLGGLGDLGNLGSLGSLANGGNLQSLIGMFGG